MPKHPRGDRPPAMMDVAAAAGVSHQTVSRVLNGSGKVADSTRERVLQAISDLGYRRNSVARALVTRRSGIIGVLTTTSAHYGPSTILLSIELAAREAGYLTVVAPLEDFAPESVNAVLDHFLGLAVEGIVIMAPVEEVAVDLSGLIVPVPVVAVTAASLGAATDVLPVSVDQVGGARQAVEHLIGLGHTDIAHVRGPENWFEAQMRESGWRAVMEAHGLPVREPRGGGWEASTGYEAGRELMAEGVPTAVFAANDNLALGVVNALCEAGLTVPGDVSVVGFDDAPATEYFRPRLTTVRQDFRRLGDKVVETLVDVIEGEARRGPVLLPAQLVLRASTARPGQSREGTAVTGGSGPGATSPAVRGGHVARG